MQHITLAHQAQPKDEVLFQEVGGEAVLLNLDSESYFGLNAVGTRIWALLGQNSSLQHAFDTLCAEYEAEPAQLESDLLHLVDEMAKAGLVQLS
jgi:Coenzyme PQQ synthesis protein D (PqqD)